MEKDELKSEPELSVVIVILGGIEYIPRCLGALNKQSDVPIPEIIIPCDERITNFDSLCREYPFVEFIQVSGRRTFAELRAIGFNNAKGKIIALTEDHCLPQPDWCANIIKEHEHSYAAVGGPVDKEGNDTILNWSIYLSDFSRYMSPVEKGPSEYLTDCNVSYKKEILNEIYDLWKDEFHETTINWKLQENEHTLHLSPKVRVLQQRSLTYKKAFRERYAFGRLFASTRVAAKPASSRIIYAGFSFLLPALFVARVAKNVFFKKRAIGKFLVTIPAITFLGVAWAWGEFVGYLTGESVKSLSPDY